MSSHWFIATGRDPHAAGGPGVEIDVDDPGHGRLSIHYTDQDLEHWGRDLAGPELGRLLDGVTALALGQDPTDLSGRAWPRWLTGPDLAGRLLRPLQMAVLLAAAGTDRCERVVSRPEDAPADPLCVNCHQGSVYHQEVVLSERCAEYGHTPFGHQRHHTWDTAAEQHERDTRWHQRRATRTPSAAPDGLVGEV